MPKGLRKKYFISYALPILFSLLLLAVMSYGLIRQSLGTSEREKLAILVNDYGHRVEQLLVDRLSTLPQVETLNYQRNFREPALLSQLAKFDKSFPVLSYLNQQGHEEVKVVRGEKSEHLIDYGDAPWFADALRQPNRPVLGGVVDDPDLGQPGLLVAYARFGYFGDEFQGVLKGIVPLTAFTTELRGLNPGRDGYAILLDHRLRVLYHPQDEVLFRPLVFSGALPSADQPVTFMTLDGARRLVARAEIPQTGWSLLAVLPYAEFVAPSMQLGWYTLLTSLLALLLGLLLARRIVRPLTLNLKKTIEHTALIAGGTLNQPLSLDSGDELDLLAESINRMSDDVSRALTARDALQGVLQSIVDPLFIFDTELRVIEINDAAAQLLRVGKTELDSRPLAELLDDSADSAAELLKRISAAEEIRNRETVLRAPGGEAIEVLLSCAAPGRETNPEVGLVMTCKDLRALRQAEAARSRALILVETLLAQSPLGILVFDGVTGICVRANQAAAEVSGGTVEQLLGLNFRQLKSWQEAGLSETAEQVLADGIARQMTKPLVTTFGRRLAVRAYLSRFFAEGRPLLMLMVQDVSDEVRLAAEKRQVEEQMLHVQKLESLGVLAGGVAHDFNNILMAVMGNAELALEQLSPTSGVASYLKQILTASGKAADLAGQMLAYSGRGVFVVEPLDLNQVVEEMAQMLKVSLSQKVDLQFDLQRQLPAVDGDPTQLRQVVMNLVINAYEAIGDRSGVISLATGVSECDAEYLRGTWSDERLEPGRYVYIEVADTGCGMDRETQEKIFDPFFTTKFTGRGLGMAAVLGIVRGHKGAIKVHSEVNRGATFKALLPVSTRPVAQAAAETVNDRWRGEGVVLLVDDEVSVRGVGRAMLRSLGLEVLTAADGREALEVYREHRSRIGLVLMDLTMPNMGGEEAFYELRRIDPEVRVLMASGYSEQEVAARLPDKGVFGIMQKPFHLATLRKLLRSAGLEKS